MTRKGGVAAAARSTLASMPYELREMGGGWKVCKKGTDRCYSHDPLTREDALKQMAALYANEPGASSSQASSRTRRESVVAALRHRTR